jgi:hypothetical protein
MKHRWLLLVLAGTAAVTSVVVLLFSPVLEHWRTQSPDGAFIAIVHTQPFRSFIPAMPGGGSDKPARITIYRDGQSCGSAWLAMASFAYELRWQIDTPPRRAEIRLAATWNLDACVLERTFSGYR